MAHIRLTEDENNFQLDKRKRDNIINKFTFIYESTISSSILDSKFIKSEIDLKLWQSFYMNKSKMIQTYFKDELKYYLNDTNKYENAFRPNCFDLEAWCNVFD